ncbi:hypothetical protein [Providencia sp. PROV260]|uniref:tail fiber/spike domain-containing protein n=1 Tax=Providencia sp. PROV260 TaxID=2949948 RepID=UPI00234B27B4|nr:hypothetical protein [Providencia sp. PROV260]
MTVSTEISSNEYTGNGVTTDFDYKFRIFKANQLSVIMSDADGDNVVTLRLGTDYTVTGANKSAGGKVILTKPLANGHKISIARDIPITQETSFRNQSKFFAKTHEDAFDYLTMIIQRIWGNLGSLYLKRPNILANWFDAKGYRIANLGKPKRDSDAVDLGTLKDEISGVNSTILKKEKRTLRVDDMDISVFPKAQERRNKQIGFDGLGIPTLVDPAETGVLGYAPLDSFEKGATLTNRYQVLFWEEKREYFRWDGNLPKVVPPNSTPNETGGIRTDENINGLWVSVGDNSLRSQLSQERKNEWPRIGHAVEIKNTYIPHGVKTIKVNGLHLINWKINGDFAKYSHSVESEPIKNEFDEYIIKTNNGDYTFVTQEIYALRMDKKLSGWGYPDNDDFSASLIKSLNALSETVIDVPVSITTDTVIDYTQIQSMACNVIADKGLQSAITIDVDTRLFLKSSRIHWKDVLFIGKEPETEEQAERVRTGIWSSGFHDSRFIGCKFVGFGDPIKYTSGTCILWFAAQATTGVPEFIQTGNSTRGRVTNCEFETTGDRTTNFAVRAYTPFDSADATCTDVIVEGSTFTGFNWNAVEFGGLGVQYCKMLNNNAYRCGLGAFDLDKGCSYCQIDNCLQDGLRGNIDIAQSPNTNAVAWHIQGVKPDAGYAHHNRVTNCRTVFYLSDMIKYPNAYGLTSSSYAYSNVITGIDLKVIYDVPKSEYLSTKKKLYAFLFDTISDTKVSKISSNLFTHGIFQFAGTNANLYPVAPCYFSEFSSDEELTGEYINIQRGVASVGQGRFIIDGLNLATNMSNASALTPIVFDVQGSSTHLLKVENSYFTTSGAVNLVSAKTGALCLNNVYELRDAINSDAVISSNSQLSYVAVTDVYTGYGRTLFDMVNLDIFASQETVVSAYINDNTQFVSGDFAMRSTRTTASAPCAIPASRIRGTITVNSPLGISSNGRTFRAWVNLASIWRLSQEVL